MIYKTSDVSQDPLWILKIYFMMFSLQPIFFSLILHSLNKITEIIEVYFDL